MPISFIVIVLLTLVITSYRQTIYAYPSGGGSYVVSRENLGETPSLVAGASLLVDYILTVAVSISAGVAAITSAFPELRPERVLLCLGFVALMMFANLRGLKESGRLFAGPTYLYMIMIIGLVGIGLVRYWTGSIEALPPNTEELNELTDNGLLLTGITAMAFLRAFSSGAVALTGIEAISNGVPAFKKPESHNAATTLIVMGVILGSFFLGLSVLANLLKPTVSENETLLSIMGSAVFGDGSVPYYVLQFATFAILILAANTAFADFPRVSSILANDGFLPRQLANRGDRLVFSNGIIALAGVASLLIIGFGGQTSALIPLYAVGVFCGFTLSQLGMVVHHKRLQEPGWRRNQVINMVGAIATFVVLIVVIVSKFSHGAWIPVVLIPLIVLGFRKIKRHYDHVATSLKAEPTERVAPTFAHRRRPDRLGEQGRAQRHRLRPIDAPRPPRRDQRGDRCRGGGPRGRRVGAVRTARRAAHRLLAVPRPHQPHPRGDRRTRRRAARRRDHGRHPRVRRRALVGPGAAQPERRGAPLEAATATEHRDHPDPRADRPSTTNRTAHTGGRP